MNVNISKIQTTRIGVVFFNIFFTMHYIYSKCIHRKYDKMSRNFRTLLFLPILPCLCLACSVLKVISMRFFLKMHLVKVNKAVYLKSLIFKYMR